VTRGTRPKKPFSSRGFAREACGAWGDWGFWGLKTENRKLKIETLSFQAKKKKIIFFLFFFIFFRVLAGLRLRGRARVRADAPYFTPGNFKKDATVRLSHGRPRGHRPIVRPSVRPSENIRVTTMEGTVLHVLIFTCF
jgi:hypothetical protein